MNNIAQDILELWMREALRDNEMDRYQRMQQDYQRIKRVGSK